MYQDQLAERQRRNENLPATETVLCRVGDNCAVARRDPTDMP